MSLTSPSPSSSASWKGKAVEQFIAARCVLLSNGRLNVSVPMVDDAGVDLVFSLRGQPQTLAVQVKSRFTTAKRVSRGGFGLQVRKATFRPREDLAILGVLYDTQIADITAAWLIPSLDFDHLTRNQAPQRRVRVMAARLKGAGNVWVPFRCQPKELADRLIATLSELGGTPVEQSRRPTLR